MSAAITLSLPSTIQIDGVRVLLPDCTEEMRTVQRLPFEVVVSLWLADEHRQRFVKKGAFQTALMWRLVMAGAIEWSYAEGLVLTADADADCREQSVVAAHSCAE